MKNSPALLTFFLIASIIASSQRPDKLHQRSILADTHNDILSSAMLEGKDISHRINEGHSDLDRWKEGGVDVQFFSVWTGERARTPQGFYQDAIHEINLLDTLVHKNPDRIVLARTYNDVKKAVKKGKLAALIGVEGGHMIEDDLSKLEELYKRGMRYMTLTWNNSTSWASSAMDEASLNPSEGGTLETPKGRKGLTGFGKEVVRKMNELGIIVDLSHTGEQTFYDAIATSSKPVLLSHSSVWNICPAFRNVKDEQIKAVARNGGVICINFYSGFIDSNFAKRMNELEGTKGKQIRDSLQQYYDAAKMNEIWRQRFSAELEPFRPTLSKLVDHIDYIVKLVGDDYVGIGSDFDGVSSLPVGLDDVTTYPKITEELMRRGYSKKSIRKILGGNVMRVMKANFK
ncbi:MAG TPA: dipeptidase [Chitinophagaceae bacterium]|nr:dipeptidase [Chitinophagaceae bacterium]